MACGAHRISFCSDILSLVVKNPRYSSALLLSPDLLTPRTRPVLCGSGTEHTCVAETDMEKRFLQARPDLGH